MAPVLAALALAACAESAPLPELRGGAEVGLRCHDGWSSAWGSVTVKPPYVMGPAHNLRIGKGRLRGTMAGLPADVRLEPDGATGMIGGRAVEIAFGTATGEIDVEGVWYGTTLRLNATDDRLRATVPTPRGACCREFDMERVPNAPPGFVVYQDRRSALSGSHLELPQVLHGWYSTPELTLLVISVLFAACGR